MPGKESVGTYVESIRTLLLDHRPLLVEAMTVLLTSHSERFQVHTFLDERGLFKYLERRDDLQLAILGCHLPGRGVIEVIKEIKSRGPNLPVLVVDLQSGDRLRSLGVRILRAGAEGYLPSSSKAEDLFDAIERVLGGKKYIDSMAAQRLAISLATGMPDIPHLRLTDREYQVLFLIASGKGTSEVAEEMSLSKKTISAHRARVLEKLDLRNNMELTRYAMHQGLVD